MRCRPRVDPDRWLRRLVHRHDVHELRALLEGGLEVALLLLPLLRRRPELAGLLQRESLPRHLTHDVTSHTRRRVRRQEVPEQKGLELLLQPGLRVVGQAHLGDARGRRRGELVAARDEVVCSVEEGRHHAVQYLSRHGGVVVREALNHSHNALRVHLGALVVQRRVEPVLVLLDADVEEVNWVRRYALEEVNWVRRYALEGDVEPRLLRPVEEPDGEVLLVEAQVEEEGVVDRSAAPRKLAHEVGQLPAQRLGHGLLGVLP
eukprot:scaffold75889_cov66-Phaeocystis_antarctica.AAC.4